MLGAWPAKIAIILTLWAPAIARAAPPKALGQAIRLYEELEYQKAAPRFQRLMTNASLDPGVRAQAAVYHAVIQLALGRSKKAKESFAIALNLDGKVELPTDASPSMQEVFDEVRASTGHASVPDASSDEGAPGGTGTGKNGFGEPVGDASGFQLPDEGEPVPTEGTETLPPPPTEVAEEPLMHHQPPAPGTSSGRIVVTLDPLRRMEVSGIEIHHRRQGESFWFNVLATAEARDRFEAEIPAPNDEGGIEYYIEARGADGLVLGALGGVATPFTYTKPVVATAPTAAITLSESKAAGGAGDWYKKWWVWTAAGAVTAGIVGGIVLATSGGCKAPDGQGCVEVTFR